MSEFRRTRLVLAIVFVAINFCLATFAITPLSSIIIPEVIVFVGAIICGIMAIMNFVYSNTQTKTFWRYGYLFTMSNALLTAMGFIASDHGEWSSYQTFDLFIILITFALTGFATHILLESDEEYVT
jgi:ABC-type transport system involved in multi-copper enzyme maturation permease subunit